jgi:hypothetical protein
MEIREVLVWEEMVAPNLAVAQVPVAAAVVEAVGMAAAQAPTETTRPQVAVVVAEAITSVASPMDKAKMG